MRHKETAARKRRCRSLFLRDKRTQVVNLPTDPDTRLPLAPHPRHATEATPRANTLTILRVLRTRDDTQITPPIVERVAGAMINH